MTKTLKEIDCAEYYLSGIEIPEHDIRIDIDFRPHINAMCVADQLKCQIITSKLDYWIKIWKWKFEKKLKKQIKSLSLSPNKYET